MTVHAEPPRGANSVLRFTTTKQKLRKLLEMCSIDQELDVVWWKYGEDGIAQKQTDPSMTIAVAAKINKSYFNEYAASEGEAKIPSTIYDVVKKYFKESDAISFNIEDTKLTMRGRDEVYECNLLETELSTFEGEVEECDFGLLPPLDAEVKGVYEVDAEEFSVKADEIRIHYGDRLKLTIVLEEGGVYSRYARVIEKRDVRGEGSVLLDGKTLKTVIDLFVGPVYLVMTDGPVIVTQKTSDYAVAYAIAPRVE